MTPGADRTHCRHQLGSRVACFMRASSRHGPVAEPPPRRVPAALGRGQPRAARRRVWRASRCSIISSIGAGTGLEDGRGVDRQPAEAEVADLLGAGDDAIVVGVEVLARRGRSAAAPASPAGRALSGRGRRPRRGRGSWRSPPGRRRRSRPTDAHPAVAELAGPAQRGGTGAADPDRERRALWRLGLHGDGVGVERLALLLDALVAPAGPQQPDRLVHLRPRRVKSSPSTSYSASCQPTPTPRRIRPPDSVSSVLTCLATRTAWRWGSTSTSVDSLTRSVTAATYPSVTSASRIGICDG